MARHNERSELLAPSDADPRGGARRALSKSFGRVVGRRTRILISGLVVALLVAGCFISFLHYQRGAAMATAPTSRLVMPDEVCPHFNVLKLFTLLLFLYLALLWREIEWLTYCFSCVRWSQFDAIVVGGGPAGAVMAKLLSDDPWRRVLLIEAGNTSQTQLGGKVGRGAIPSALNVNKLTPFDVPFYWTNVANTLSVHWAYPDVNIAKALGGCGIHNAMLYDRWGMNRWTWAKAREIYLGIEDYDGPNSSYHNTQGFVRTSPPSMIDDVSKAFVNACEQVGIPRTVDFNAPGGRYGAGFYDFNTRNGVRESAAKSFLGPILDDNAATSNRENFRLLLDTTVTKITINDANVTKGVEVRYGNGTGQIIRLAEHGKVILTAGAINTPKVLMLSGIGHRDMLQKVRLPVKKHLPRVGMNLQDHPVLGVTFQCVSPFNVDLE
ncbi:hypothetical protein BBJ28_00007306 [Nothophytophthora sp. Chile5]|nr:hypothetical protein BBJ28_00007306 [Nothophytophthora sp. Chile5]